MRQLEWRYPHVRRVCRRLLLKMRHQQREPKLWSGTGMNPPISYYPAFCPQNALALFATTRHSADPDHYPRSSGIHRINLRNLFPQ